MVTRRKSTSKRKTATAEVKAENTGSVVGSTMDKPEEKELTGADVIYLRVSLRSPVRFDDIPDGKGGTKSVVLPGLDEDLRGKRDGILAPDGNAIFYQLPRKDWENLLAMYGDSRMFHSYKGFPACVAEVGSISDARKGAYDDEISETRTGYAPVDPKAENVEVSKAGEDY
jgi:hypothetical protein